MLIELNDKELKALAELVFVGDWMVNAVRVGNEQIKEYRQISNEILKQYLKTLSDKEKEEFKNVEDLRDCYMDELCGYMDYYDEKTLIPRIAEELSEINYPDGCGENFMMSLGMQGSAKHIYEELLSEKGLGIIKLDCAEFEEQIATSWKYWRLVYGKLDMPDEERKTLAKALADSMREKRQKEKSEENNK